MGKALGAALGILASVLVILAVGLYEGYITPSLVDNLTDTELGVFGAIAIVAAIFTYRME